MRTMGHHTLVNLIDNYVQLVLSVYSVVFKDSNYDWVMMMVFCRRHYDKALLIALSNFHYWHEKDHPLHQVIQQFLKTKAAEYLLKKFELIHSHPGQNTQRPR